MTFKTVEISKFGGEPLELFRFTQGASIWTYTSADVNINFNAEVYASQPIERTNLVASDEASFDMEIQLPRTLAPADQFISGAIPAPIWLTLYRKHVSDPQGIVAFVGQLREGSFEAGVCTLHAVPLKESLSRQIPRHGYQNTCNNVLYDSNCKMVANSFKSTGTVATKTGNVITATLVPSRSAPYFKTGVLEFGVYKTMIIDHVGSNLTLLTVLPGLIVGSSINCYAGCDRQQATCFSKFANVVNFRGFPWIPIKNPFEGVV